MKNSPPPGRPGMSRQSGMTMIELMVASVIALVFMLAAGTGYLVNQKAYKANIEKLELQQTASHVMEIIERRIREAATATVPPSHDRLELFDMNGNPTTSFRMATFGPRMCLYEGTVVLCRQELISIVFIPSNNNDVIEVQLTLKDENKNSVGLRASAALRNSAQLRNWKPQ